MMSLAKIEFSPFWRRFIWVREILIMDEDIYFLSRRARIAFFSDCVTLLQWLTINIRYQLPIIFRKPLEKKYGWGKAENVSMGFMVLFY